MILRLTIATVLTGALLGCAYRGHSGLLKDAYQKEYAYTGAQVALSDCLAQKFNNEPFGMWDLPAPVTTTLNRADGLQMISSLNNIWFWNLLLTPTEEGTTIKVEVRKSVNPYLSNSYMLNKVTGYLDQCGAVPKEPKV